MGNMNLEHQDYVLLTDIIMIILAVDPAVLVWIESGV